jgi:serine phosphatase RsbU (regulator of sigma subunit)/DNA-binding NarL/FixJ family response regulator
VSGSAALASLVVLVLDDREESRYLASTWLTRSGFAVIEATTGAEAIDVLDNEHIDIAILDVNLPDMTGYEVCEHIRASPRTAPMPVIHLSATAVGSADRSEGLLRGADAFLVEPLEARDLLATMTALIRRSDMRARGQLTSDRLRALNNATADVHAASNDDQLFRAVLVGAGRLAGRNAVMVRRARGGGELMALDSDGRVASRDVAGEAIDRLLAPALAGISTLETNDPELTSTRLIGAPFVDELGEPTGAILVAVAPDDADDEILPLLAQLSIAVALARANMQALDLEHRIALVLQQSLLPQEPGEIDGLDQVFRYIASSRHTEIGGDFYETLVLGPGLLGIAIGDVVGHSLRAAVVMGELRHALRAYAIDGYDPPGVVERLDRLVRRLHPTMFTSLVYGTIDVAAGEFRFCNAGHLPPLLLAADGSATYLEPHGAPIGLGFGVQPFTTVAFRPGDRLLLVTDGLIERKRESIDVSLQRLRDTALAARHQPLGSLVDRLVVEVGPADAPDDDIAIVAVHRR